MRRSPRWDELSTARQLVVMLVVSIKISLAVSAWADLAERPPELVNGSKTKWATVIGIVFVGPIMYYVRGRRAFPTEP